ncbi:MAG: MFS transporter [Eubacteriaceae bacterium]|jgi:GPH family glycoside/pentoside/hexuronide:cation symporter
MDNDLSIKQKEQEVPKSERLSVTEKLAYGSGDMACNIVFGMISSLLTLFYTDYAGVAPTIIGMVFLISRCFDGVSDVVMGFIVEKTKSKYGQSRPWIIRMAIPYAISAVLLFTVPQTTGFMQGLYIFVTYNLCTTVCYTALNLPYGSLSTMMTRSSEERGMLSIFRMAMSPFGRILSVSFTLPVVKLFGNDQMAWAKTMGIWAVVAVALLVFCFAQCKETVEIPARKKIDKTPLKIALKALATNQYFWAGLILWMIQSCMAGLTGTVLPYYTKYIFNNDNLYSYLFLAETLTMIATTFLSPWLLRKMGKRNMSLAGVFLALAGQLIYMINPYSYSMVMMSCIVRGLGMAPFASVVFAMIGDAVEFGQWKTHLRQESLIFAGGSVGTKVGSGVIAAIITGMMSMAGYVTSTSGVAVQSQSVLNTIVNLYKFGPLIAYAILIIVLLIYKLDKMYPQIMQDLAEREGRGEL